MKKIVKYAMLIAIAAVVAIACKDNFSEQDFLNSQLKSKAKQDSLSNAAAVAAMNSAGQLLSYTLQVVDDKTPVAGVEVIMTNPPAATTTPTVTATTDAQGFVQFKNVPIGANTFIISKTGYHAASIIVDFGTIEKDKNYTIVNDKIVPIKKTASNRVPIFANAVGESTATIRGKVTIETDLTNTTPEVPQGLVLKANLVGAITGIGATSSLPNTANQGQSTITSYSFKTSSIGTATVDNTTGNYSLVVPASEDGREISLIYPIITANQKVGFDKLDGVQVPAQIRADIPTIFGPSLSAVGAAYDAIPSTPGVVATVTPANPPAPGTGLKATFTPRARALETGFISVPLTGYNTTKLTNTIYQLNRGSGYNNPPTVTFSGGGASTDATAKTRLKGYVTGITITNGGSGYTGVVTFNLALKNADGITPLSTSFTVDVGTTPVALSRTNISIPAAADAGFKATNPFSTHYVDNTSTFSWLISGGGGTGATATPTVSASVDQIQITEGGEGYTSAPTIAIGAPASGGTQATLTVVEFATQWTIAMDNSGSANSYKIKPSNIYYSTVFEGTTKNWTRVSDQSGVVSEGSNTDLKNVLTVSGGNVVFVDNSLTYYTNAFSSAVPTLFVTPATATPALAVVSVYNTLTSSDYGKIGSISFEQGSGYDVPVAVAIAPLTGLSGSGAVVNINSLLSFNTSTREYELALSSPATLISRGSGYQPYANMYYAYYNSNSPGSAVNFNGTTSAITVKTGDVVNLDINYGTGARKTKIN